MAMYPNAKKFGIRWYFSKKYRLACKKQLAKQTRLRKYGNFSRNRRNLKRKLLARNKICFWCDTELTFKTATIDHIVPAAVRRDNSLKNLRLIHEGCRVMRDRAIATGLLKIKYDE